MSSSSLRRLFAATTVIATFAVAQVCPSAVLITTATYDAGSRSGTASVSSSILPIVITAARYDLMGYDSTTAASLTYQTYAYDLVTTLTGGIYTPSTLASKGLSAAKQGQLNALIANTATIAATADSSAAVQLAIWEVINETSTTGYSLGTGGFYAGGATSPPQKASPIPILRTSRATFGKRMRRLRWACSRRPTSRTRFIGPWPYNSRSRSRIHGHCSSAVSA